MVKLWVVVDGAEGAECNSPAQRAGWDETKIIRALKARNVIATPRMLRGMPLDPIVYAALSALRINVCDVTRAVGPGYYI